ncbi:MAG: thiamine-phosphate kinase [Burkholderiales bacterium]
MLSEFEIIRRYFTRPTFHTVLGVGDDCALIRVAPGAELAVSTDMLVSGCHFHADADPEKLGHKALAVNLSDMAAMGANPRWATLSLALPTADEIWLTGFSRGFLRLAERYDVDLVGGDTTRGPLAICVQIMGEVSAGHALRRDGAQPGDEVWVSGHLGDAALLLAHLAHEISLEPREVAACLPRLHEPEPRVALGQALVGVARSAIDISDGLAADLGHILERSKVAAVVELPRVPRSPVLDRHLPATVALRALLSGGDDYELCFTAPVERHGDVLRASDAALIPVTRVGHIVPGSGLTVLDEGGRPVEIDAGGWDHFGANAPAPGCVASGES